MEIIITILFWTGVVFIGLFALLTPKSDRRTRTGNKSNASNAPGCLMVVGLIAGLLGGLLWWITGISPL